MAADPINSELTGLIFGLCMVLVCDTTSRTRVKDLDQQSFTKQIYLKATLIQLVFLANVSCLFCSLFDSRTREHSLKIVAIDYD